jgi:V/A-type H+-transporting ATPase subunit C
MRVEIGYVNARVRGMKRDLFDSGSYDRLLHKPDIDGVIAELELTPYREEIERASVKSSGIRCVEDALRMNLARKYRVIHRIVKGERFEKHVSVYLNRWDIQNIKTVLRGKSIHVTTEEILGCVVPAGELDEATLVELAKQDDIRSVIDLLATWDVEYARPLTRSYEKYSKKRDLAVLEYSLDKFYFKRALGLFTRKNQEDATVRDLIATEIDCVNIKSVLRLIREGVDPEEGRGVLIEGGTFFDTEKLISMIESKSVEDAVAALTGTPYAFLQELPRETTTPVTISAYENELDRFLIRKGIAALRSDPLSIAVVIGYLWAKNNEITNIRIIARGKAAFIPDEELQEKLLYV